LNGLFTHAQVVSNGPEGLTWLATQAETLHNDISVLFIQYAKGSVHLLLQDGRVTVEPDLTQEILPA